LSPRERSGIEASPRGDASGNNSRFLYRDGVSPRARRHGYTIDVSNQKMYLESLNKNRFRESVTFEEFEVSEERGPSLVGRMAAAWWC
jgi:hypothetical protein